MGAVQSSGVEELSSHSGQGGGLVQKKASTYPDPVLFMNSALIQTVKNIRNERILLYILSE